MTNLQFCIAVGLPAFVIVTSLIVSLVRVARIGAEIRELRADTKAIIASLGSLSSRLGCGRK